MFIRKKDYMLLVHRIEYLEDPIGKFKLGDKVVVGCDRNEVTLERHHYYDHYHESICNINPPKNGVYYDHIELNVELVKNGRGCVQSNIRPSPEDEEIITDEEMSELIKRKENDYTIPDVPEDEIANLEIRK